MYILLTQSHKITRTVILIKSLYNVRYIKGISSLDNMYIIQGLAIHNYSCEFDLVYL